MVHTNAGIELSEQEERLVNHAYSLSYRQLAEFVELAKGRDRALYSSCLEARLQLHWGRIANWYIHSAGLLEREAIRLANEEVGGDFAQRMAKAKAGRFNETDSTEKSYAKARADSIVDESVSLRIHKS